MRVRMLVDRTGTDDGRSYPAPPGEIDVPDDLGKSLCEHGWAAPVAQPDVDVEKRHTPPQAPTPAPPATDGKPAVNAPKADWVAYAVTKGSTSTDAEALTKEQLVKRYGS